MGAGDDVNAHEVAFHGLDGLGAGVGRGLYGGDVADHRGGDEGVADLDHRTDQFHVRRLEHRVGRFDQRDEAAGFNESYCLLGHRMNLRFMIYDLRVAESSNSRFASRATTSSSFVGMTNTFTRELAALMTASVAPVAAFLSVSSAMPSCSRFAQMAARTSARFSPMPAVKAM